MKVAAFAPIVLLILSAAAAAVAASAEQITPALKPDPAVMKIIDGLGDNSSARLPKLKTTGDINAVARRYHMDVRGPGARDYCIKMVWMPDRERAIFYGANHGSPHRTNDVWEYDLASNTWVCLYGPDLMRGAENWKKNLDRESLKTGIPRTKRGGPAVVPHSWWQMAYDPDLKAMLTFCSWSMVPKEVREAQKRGKHKPPLWAFYPEKKKWDPITGSTFKGRRPRYHNASALEYVPELKATVWTANSWANRGMWTYDSRTNTWTDLKPNGGNRKAFQKNAPGSEQVMVYAPDRKMLIGHQAGRDRETKKRWTKTTHYSIEKNAWRRVKPTGHGEDGFIPPGHDARTNFAYDQVGKVALLWAPSTKALWSYDPAGMKWTEIEPNGPPPPTRGRDVKLAYYDVAHNVFVIPGKWIYRYNKEARR
ncbi:MAG: hypothetical protein R6V58_13035 [Planctomycetota bacterium]